VCVQGTWLAATMRRIAGCRDGAAAGRSPPSLAAPLRIGLHEFQNILA